MPLTLTQPYRESTPCGLWCLIVVLYLCTLSVYWYVLYICWQWYMAALIQHSNPVIYSIDARTIKAIFADLKDKLPICLEVTI